MEILRSQDGTELAVIAATWELNPKVSFESLAPEFKANPTKAWRNYGSRLSGGGLDLAIRDPEQVLAHLNVLRSDPWDYVRKELRPHVRGRRGTRYFIHIDLAKNKDRVGIACTHREPTGVVVVDFMHTLSARPGQNIDFEEVRGFVFLLHQRGFAIEQVSYDLWQSEESRQILEKAGFTTEYLSADRTTGPYDTLIEMLLTDRLDYYNHPVFIKELKALRTNGVKYDHPKKGSKDLADAVACATWAAINYELENPTEPPGKIKVVAAPYRRALTSTYGERSRW